MDKFTFDRCSICGKHKALKNGVCADCDKEIEMPEWFKDLFKEDKNG
jgi:hypothetical protein